MTEHNGLLCASISRMLTLFCLPFAPAHLAAQSFTLSLLSPVSMIELVFLLLLPRPLIPPFAYSVLPFYPVLSSPILQIF
jgi:hypothetical protein